MLARVLYHPIWFVLVVAGCEGTFYVSQKNNKIVHYRINMEVGNNLLKAYLLQRQDTHGVLRFGSQNVETGAYGWLPTHLRYRHWIH